VKGVRRLGVRVGNWLTAEEAKKLLGAETADTLRSRRNRALLSLLIGCGLRRAEVTNLRLEDLQLREGHWVIADLRGKGGHIRTIPVPQWVKDAVDNWTVGAGITAGPLLRSIKKAGRIWGQRLYSKGDLGNRESKREMLRSAIGGTAATGWRNSACRGHSPDRTGPALGELGQEQETSGSLIRTTLPRGGHCLPDHL
jgi:integrase